MAVHVSVLGLDAGAWSALFAGVQALAVISGVGFGISQLLEVKRRRAWESLDKMFEMWRASLSAQYLVLGRMPTVEGDLPTQSVHLAAYLYGAAVSELSAERDECAALLEAARDVVHALNDIGVYVERGNVRQADFYAHYHVRVIELVVTLEPLIFLVSACRGPQWGLRLRRLRIGAERYHRAARLHRELSVRVGGCTVVDAAERSRTPARLHELRLTRNLIPSRESRMEENRRLVRTVAGQLDTSLATLELDRARFLDALPVRI